MKSRKKWIAGLAVAFTLAFVPQSFAWMAGPMYGNQPPAMQQQQAQTGGAYSQGAPGWRPMNKSRFTTPYPRTGGYMNSNAMNGYQGPAFMGCRW